MRGSLDFPNVLHFAKIAASCPIESSESVADLKSSCSDTLESLTVGFNPPSLFPFASVVSQYLTPAVAPRPLVLSEAIKLKGVKFKCIALNVQWIVTTLRTAKPTNLRKITITITSPDRLVNPVGEMVRREWRDLDYLLDQLWPHIRFSRRSCTRRVIQRMVWGRLFEVCWQSSQVWGSSTCVKSKPVLVVGAYGHELYCS